MLRTTLSGLLSVLFVASTASATIEEWTSASSGFTIDEDTVLITGAGTYKFQSYDGITPADIQWIRVQSGVTGTVTVHVYQDPNDGDGVGAANVKEIDLSGATLGIINQLTISGNLAADANGTPGEIICDYNYEPITGHTIVGDITAERLHDVTLTGVGTHDGSITTTDTYYHTLTIGSPTNPSSTINTNIDIPNFYGLEDNQGGRFYFYGDMHGTIDVTYNWCGSMYLTGDLCNDISIGDDLGIEHADYDRAWIYIDGDITTASDPNDPDTINCITVDGDSYRGIIHVEGDMGGRIAITGDICIRYGTQGHGGDTGWIRIYGDMQGRVAHPSRREGWGRDCVAEARTSRSTPNRQARRFV